METLQRNKTFHMKTQNFFLIFVRKESNIFHTNNLHSAFEKKKRIQRVLF